MVPPTIALTDVTASLRRSAFDLSQLLAMRGTPSTQHVVETVLTTAVGLHEALAQVAERAQWDPEAMASLRVAMAYQDLVAEQLYRALRIATGRPQQA
ncbi:hypothetical protein JNW90_01240 [Micromonospora sp. STR1s_5]|nr:hypothetical protein [Micromonospora sp. STR1s_5]